MRRIKLTDNGVLWLAAIGFIFVPLLVIHLSSTETVPRILSVVFLFTAFPSVLIVRALSASEKPLSNAPRLKGRYSSDALRKWDIAIKVLGAFGAMLMLYYMTIPLLGGVYRYTLRHHSLEIVEGMPINPSSALFGQIWLVQSFGLEETGRDYQFWFPNLIRVDERYEFLVLPGTAFVVDSHGPISIPPALK